MMLTYEERFEAVGVSTWELTDLVAGPGWCARAHLPNGDSMTVSEHLAPDDALEDLLQRLGG